MTVLGVMPATFQFPYGAASLLEGVASEHRSELWHPFQRQPQPLGRIGHVVGRLREGRSIEQAQADLRVIARSVQADLPGSTGEFDVYLVPLADAVISDPPRLPPPQARKLAGSNHLSMSARGKLTPSSQAVNCPLNGTAPRAAAIMLC